MIVSSSALDEVRHLRVTPDNPPTSDDDHLDYERCAALHNAIVKHAWIAIGRNPGDLHVRHQWPPSDEAVLQEGQERLHPDVISFLSLANDPADPFMRFWYSLGGLWRRENLWKIVEGWWDEDYVALYVTNDDSSAVGIM